MYRYVQWEWCCENPHAVRLDSDEQSEPFWLVTQALKQLEWNNMESIRHNPSWK